MTVRAVEISVSLYPRKKHVTLNCLEVLMVVSFCIQLKPKFRTAPLDILALLFRGYKKNGPVLMCTVSDDAPYILLPLVTSQMWEI